MSDVSSRDVSAVSPKAVWPWMDFEFDRLVAPLLYSPNGLMVHADQNRAYRFDENRTFPVGRPLAVMPGRRGALDRLVAAYHRAIETIVTAYPHDRRVRAVLSMPSALHEDLQASPHPADSRVHFMRMDVLPQTDGSVRVLETNANCPGALVVAGHVARRWREHLTTWGTRLPEPLAAEDPLWMGKWFTRVAEQETGELPSVVALLRQQGGNRMELDLVGAAFEGLGVRTIEADPREVEASPRGVRARGVEFAHAYLKVGLQEFCAMREHVRPFVDAVRGGRLFVQNRQLGRWVGDNKLCLALLSDPEFSTLFDKDDLALIAPSIPWSRNVGTCPLERVESIRRDPEGYVLKRPLDTRGRGVIVGCETESLLEWSTALDRARNEGWLVQQYCDTTEMETEPGTGATRKHDLALGAVNGSLSAAFVRAGGEPRLNIARTGHLHPLYLGFR